MRLLAAMLALCLAVGAAPSTRAAPAPRDFISRMTVPLAVDPDSAAQSADREIARLASTGQSGPTIAAAEAYWVKAQSSFRLGATDDARRALATARRLAPVDASGNRVRAYADLLDGLLARGDGDLATALIRFRRAQQGFISAGDRRGQALALQSVGVLYNDVGNGVEALRYLTLAEDSYGGDDVFLLSLNNNFGVAYQVDRRFADAEARLRVARRYAQRLEISGFSQQITLNIAASQIALGNFDAARRSLAEFDAVAGAGSPLSSEADSLRAQIALGQGRPADSLRYIERVLAGVDPRASDRRFLKAHFVAYQANLALGQHRAALEQLEAVRLLDATDAQLTASNRAALLSAQFQFSAQATQIAQLKAENLEREVSFQRTMTVTIVIGSVLALGLLLGLLVTAIRARNRARSDSAELAVVNQRLEQALAAKTEFLASTSHELRTPLNGILGMTQILLADAGVTAHHRIQIELLHDAGSTMRALVDDILDVAKIEHGGFTINPKPTDVAALAQRVTRLFEAQSRNAGLTLDLVVEGDGAKAMVDPDRLTQILFNLIGNAIKFTPEGLVQVSLSTSAGDTPMLHLQVRDSGIGIAPEWHDSVFDMFRQVDGARTRNYGGTGLGLAICRQLARAMGGDIALDSAPGEGSTFTVSLPWQAVPDGPAESGVRPVPLRAVPDDLADHAVVIVAHDPMRIAMLAAIVRRSGGAVSIADTAAQAVSALESPKSLTLLVDASAWRMVETIIGGQAGYDHPIIIVGDTDGEKLTMQANGMMADFVAFSRNAIVAALQRAATSNRPVSADSVLPAAPCTAIPLGQTGSEPKRSARMSRK